MQYHSAGSSRELERRVIGTSSERTRARRPSRPGGAPRSSRGRRPCRRARAPRRTPARRRARLRAARGSDGRGSGAARSAPGPGSTPSRRDVRRIEAGLRREHAVVELAAPARHAGLDPAALELLVLERRLELRVEHLDARRRSRWRSLARRRRRAPTVLLGLDLALRARSRMRVSSAAPRSPSSGSVRTRKSSSPRRQTTSGAITRAFAVSSSAGHASPTCERLDVVRDHPLEVVRRVRPAQRRRTHARTSAHVHAD